MVGTDRLRREDGAIPSEIRSSLWGERQRRARQQRAGFDRLFALVRAQAGTLQQAGSQRGVRGSRWGASSFTGSAGSESLLTSGLFALATYNLTALNQRAQRRSTEMKRWVVSRSLPPAGAACRSAYGLRPSVLRPALRDPERERADLAPNADPATAGRTRCRLLRRFRELTRGVLAKRGPRAARRLDGHTREK